MLLWSSSSFALFARLELERIISDMMGGMMKNKSLELLAPAGNMISLHAAVSAGADAVYLGLDTFNARRGAENFSLDTLEEACDYAHLRQVKVYLALNIAILPTEIVDALETARQAYRRGVDAFIVQDLGLASEISRVLPDAKVHISTQMNTMNEAGLEAAKKLGASRVTLARELSLAEIRALSPKASDLGLELEAFTHGALCISYSGQCFMSSMIGGRSANRGLCAQACRLPYELHNKAVKKALSAEGDYLLSPKDLCTLDILPEMVEAGIRSFKIEGRMKSPEYVHAVTRIYREALDALDGRGPDKAELAEVFSRGFTTAYLEQKRGNEIMSYGRPNNRGVFIGRVGQVRGSQVTLRADLRVNEGDRLEFWTSKGHFSHEVQAREAQSCHHGDGVFWLQLAITKPVSSGDRVFRVRNASLVFEDNPFEPRIPVDGKIVLEIGKPLMLSFKAAGEAIKVEGTEVEAARTKEVSNEEIYEHVNRLGNTPFVLREFDITCDPGVGIGFSQLHRLRSQALEALENELLKPYKNRSLEKSSRPNYVRSKTGHACSVAVFATNPSCARAAKRAGAEIIYTPVLNYKRGQALIAGQVSETAEQAGYPKQSIIALPVVEHDIVEGSREFSQGCDVWDLVKPNKPLFVENLGQLKRAHDEGAHVEVGPHIPILNLPALQLMADWGAHRVWLSPELNLEQIEGLGLDSPLPLGLTVIGYQELMTSEHCFLMSQGPCNEDCKNCVRRKSPHYLKDRKGYEFAVVTDVCGRSHLYNAVEFDVAHAVPELIRSGVSALMVDSTLMNVEETTKAVERLVRARNIAVKSGDKLSKKEGATTGHLFRGVL